MIDFCYYSYTGNTKSFIQRLDIQAFDLQSETPTIQKPFILFTPTYGGRCEGYIPVMLKNFLSENKNLYFLRGIIGSGNRSFGKTYCLTARILSERYHIPLLYTYELCGTPKDIDTVKGIISKWTVIPQK